MGWSPRTRVSTCSAETAAELMRLVKEGKGTEEETLPPDMDNSEIVHSWAASCRHFDKNGTCPYGSTCHFKHDAWMIGELKYQRTFDAVEAKLSHAVMSCGRRFDDSNLLWGAVLKHLVPNCPSLLHDGLEGISWVHVPNPAAFLCAFGEEDIYSRIELLLQEACVSDAMRRLLTLLRAGKDRALEAAIPHAVEEVARQLDALQSPERDPDEDDDFDPRNVRQRDLAYEAQEARRERARDVGTALARLEEVRELLGKEVTGEVWRKSLEDLRDLARKEGVAGGCATRGEYVRALERKGAFRLSDYEKMRFAFSEAAESGAHVVIRHEVL